MKKKIRKSEQLPKYGTPLRTRLVDIVTTLPRYQEGIKKGFPLFTEDELDLIKMRYKDDKLTWEDIDNILSGKGVIFKKPTFRKYIQDGIIPGAIDHRKTANSRVALFQEDTISQINFVQYYYKILDGELRNKLIDYVKNQQVTYAEAIEARLPGNDTLFRSAIDYLVYMNEDIVDAIDKALDIRPSDRDNILKILDNIYNEYVKTIEPKISEFIDSLEKKTISVSETMGDERKTEREGKYEEFRRKSDEELKIINEIKSDGKERSFIEVMRLVKERTKSISETTNNEKGTKNE